MKYFWSAVKGVPVIHDAYAQASIKLTRYDANLKGASNPVRDLFHCYRYP